MSLLLLGAGGAGTFSPNQISGFVAEFNPSRSLSTNNLWQNSAKTTPATANNDPVRVVVDPLSGIEWTAPSDAARGLLKISGSYAWIELDGSDDQYNSGITLTGSGATTSFTAACAAYFGGSAQYMRVVADWGSSNKSFVLGTTFGSSRPLLEVQTSSGSAGALGASNLSAGQWYRLLGERLTGTHNLYVDGSSVATATLAGTLSTGAGISIGVARDGGRLAGRVAGAVIYTTALSAANLTLLDNYLRSLYA